ncbi:MAG: DNA polymerase III subunit delta' [Candidatus Omnitrophota bacterium]
MILLKDIKGQNNAVKCLLNTLGSGRIAASYLFFGPEGVGRALTARAFIRELIASCQKDNEQACGVCPVCRRVEAGEHPDLIWINPDKGESIKIEKIREAKERLSLRPYEAPFNVCVIENAHMMTVNAANALLKLMEEPPGESVIILISNKKELLLATVLSRCTEIRFRYLPVDTAKEIILACSEDINDKEAYFLARISQGSPGKALEMREQKTFERKKEIIRLVETIAGESTPFLMDWDTENKEELLEDIEMIIILLRDMALKKEGMPEQVLDKSVFSDSITDIWKEYKIEDIYRIVERLIKIKRALESNVNPKIAAQVLPGELVVG